jgi:threonine/homoserine/homoserine lactone efflux protein
MYGIVFLEGIAIGFLLATPIGPIGVICVHRTLAYGKRQGLITGLSGASADIIYALIAAFGVTLISNFVYEWQFWIRLGGGMLLLLLGIHILRSDPKDHAAAEPSNNYHKVFVPTFLLALTNPMSMFGFGAVFSSTGICQTAANRSSLMMVVAGVFIGSFLWFSLLTAVTTVFKKRLRNGGLAMVNRLAGLLFIIFGAVSIWSCALAL